MYGLILESICEAFKARYGEENWKAIVEKAGITHNKFITHKTYSESVVPRLTKAAREVTGQSVDDLMSLNGEKFVSFVGTYGYDRILRVLGRHMRDFLNGLDNLHEYLRFSYPKLKPPSFFCENETSHGLTLHYRSKRKGFLYYVMGQIQAVGEQFYKTHVDIDIVSEDETLDMTHVVMQLHFDNTAYIEPETNSLADLDNLPISSEVFFDVFPFHIVFNKTMVICNIGCGLSAVMPDVVGQAIDEMFTLSRPLVEFSLENVLMHTNNVFELTSVDPIRRIHSDGVLTGTIDETGFCTCAARDDEGMDERRKLGNMCLDCGMWRRKKKPCSRDLSVIQESLDLTLAEDEDDPDDSSRRLRLKGQMMCMQEWNAIIFLGTPVMENLEKMFDTGLYINDLSMHDSSRDLVLAGTQQSAELKLALDQEQQKSKKLEESMMKLDVEMKRTDSLLYQMIPKTVADRLRKGEPAVNTCEVFDQVTILFSDVVGFTRICSQITPMAVVSLLNAMYTKFDKLSEKHRVYKVETIGDAYMVVSGAPTVTKFHSQYIGDMAFDMMETMKELIDPSTGQHMQIRTGAHSGTVVGGVVGLKMPRYCLFGETVNTAARLEANGEAMKIHISETTKKHLEGFPYKVEERTTIEIKGKGSLKTYWLTGKVSNPTGPKAPMATMIDGADEHEHIPPAVVITEDEGNGGEGDNSRSYGYTPITLDSLDGVAMDNTSTVTKDTKSNLEQIAATLRDKVVSDLQNGDKNNGRHDNPNGTGGQEVKDQEILTPKVNKGTKSQACSLL